MKGCGGYLKWTVYLGYLANTDILRIRPAKYGQYNPHYLYIYICVFIYLFIYHIIMSYISILLLPYDNVHFALKSSVLGQRHQECHIYSYISLLVGWGGVANVYAYMHILYIYVCVCPCVVHICTYVYIICIIGKHMTQCSIIFGG